MYSQVIPLAYRCPLPPALAETIPDCLTSIPHAWLLPNLFSFIWTRLRTQPAGDSSGQPEWALKVRPQTELAKIPIITISGHPRSSRGSRRRAL